MLIFNTLRLNIEKVNPLKIVFYQPSRKRMFSLRFMNILYLDLDVIIDIVT